MILFLKHICLPSVLGVKLLVHALILSFANSIYGYFLAQIMYST